MNIVTIIQKGVCIPKYMLMWYTTLRFRKKAMLIFWWGTTGLWPGSLRYSELYVPKCWDFRHVSTHLDLFLILASPASPYLYFLFLKDRGTQSIYEYKYMSVWVYVYKTHLGRCPESSEKSAGFPKLKTPVFLSLLAGGLQTELWLATRAARTFNCWSFSSASSSYFY